MTDNQTKPTLNKSNPFSKGLLKWLKILSLVVIGLILTVFASLICFVKIVTPEQLTALIVRVANETLDADVSVGRAELSMRASYPFLNIDVDNLAIVSHALKKLPADQRAVLPANADTLLTLEKFHGGINAFALLGNKLALSDVILTAPQVNIVMAKGGVNNFDIYTSTDTTSTDTTKTELPEIELNRFAIENARDITFFEGESNLSGKLALTTTEIRGNDIPVYKLDFSGDFFASLLKDYDINNLTFALNGKIDWKPKEPDVVSFNDFDFQVAMLKMLFSTQLDMSNDLIVKSGSFRLQPTSITELLTLVPDSMMRSWGMTEKLITDAKISIGADLTKPFNVSTDSIPHAVITVDLPEVPIEYGQIKLNSVAFNAKANLNGNDLDKATVDINNLYLAGPMTDLRFKGNISGPMADPLVDGELEGNVDLDKMPPILRKMIGGTVKGDLSAELKIKARPSMFEQNTFHRLKIDGDIDARNIRWHANDGSSNAYVSNACFNFGTSRSIKQQGGATADSLLSASITVDSVNFKQTECTLTGTKIKLGVGASNKAQKAGSKGIIPIGGGLSFNTLNFNSITDSMKVKAEDVNGKVILRRYEGDAHRPELIFDLNAGRIATGDPSMRMMLSKSDIHLNAYKLPETKREKAIRHIADSLHRVLPKLDRDSLYNLAVNKYRSRNGERIHSHEHSEEDTEIIDLCTAPIVQRLLKEWSISGSMSGKRASLFTAYFPVRTRVRNLNLTFNNDSINMNNVTIKAGRSDLSFSGCISNIRRSLTSHSHRSPLKIVFDVNSDTIDVNQLADIVFKGAAYSDNTAALQANTALLDNTKSDEEFDKLADNMAESVPDSAGPLLIPTNIDAELKVKAKNILYSDLLLHDLKGDAMMYDGALNLQNLKAASDIGSINLSALYSAPTVKDMKFGFGMLVKGFKIEPFLKLMPAIDSIMPILNDFSGVIDADIAATADIDENMDINMPSLSAAIKLEGDSLKVMDEETYKIMAKWLLFKDKKHNMIDHMAVEMIVDNNMMQIYPFIFDIDRYKLGVQGYNSLAMDFNYHVAVLKSPIPFKFGINIKGNPDKYKIRLGRAKFNEKTAVERVAMVDTTRVNLLKQIENVFRRGVRNSKMSSLNIANKPNSKLDNDTEDDNLSAADSLLFIQEGLIEAPVVPATTEQTTTTKDSKSKKRKSTKSNASSDTSSAAVLNDDKKKK
jgi:hypothetical protein